MRLSLAAFLAVGFGLLSACDSGTPASGCNYSADCGAGFTCVSGKCEAVAADVCNGRGQCTDGAACASGLCSNGCCQPACASALDCGPGEACRSGVCGPATQEGCGSNADCSATPATPFCFAPSRACVACLSSADCGDATRRCTDAHACALIEGRCRSDADCTGRDRHCDTAQSVCVGCLADADCPGQRCRSDRSCGPLGSCVAPADCAAPTPACRRTDGSCVECVSNADCATGRCSNALCIAPVGGCAVEADCVAPTARCRTADRTCVACLSDADCGTGKACEQGACVLQGCGSDADCASTPATPFCRTDVRRCVACATDAQCTAGSTCQNETCVTVPGLGGACGVGSTCPAPLVCLGDAASTVCRAPCDLFASRCGQGMACAFTGFDLGGRLTGACLPANGAAVGETCSDAQPCRPDLACVRDSAAGGTCRALCDLTRPVDTCAAPDECQAIATVDGRNVPRTYGVCFPNTKLFDPCANEAACDAGQVCAASIDGAAPTQLVNACQWPEGTKGTAAACDADSECKSGFCLSGAPTGFGSTNNATAGYCDGACAADVDCPAQNSLPGACGDLGFAWYDASGAPATRELPACVVQCRNELNCRADDTCVPLPNHSRTAWTRQCLPGNTAARGSWGGATCTQDSQCWSGVCLQFGSNTTDGFCLGACNTGSTGGCDSPGECAPYGVLQRLSGPDRAYGTPDDVVATSPLCWGRTCLRDADCAGQSADAAKPRVCGADIDPRNANDLLTTCMPREGSRKGGAECSADTDCASGWCVGWTKNGVTKNRCFGTCQTATVTTDCTTTTAAPTSCVAQKLNASSTRTVSMCVPVF